MMWKPNIIALGVLSGLMLAISLAPSHEATAREQCIADWAQASAIVQKQKMVDIDRLSVLAQRKYGGRIMTARLCKGDNVYFYRLVIRRNDGRVERIKIDAHDPTK